MSTDSGAPANRRLALVEIPIETPELERAPPGSVLTLALYDREVVMITVPGGRSIEVQATVLNAAIEIIEAARRSNLFIAGRVVP